MYGMVVNDDDDDREIPLRALPAAPPNPTLEQK